MQTLPEDPGDRQQPFILLARGRNHVQGSLWTWLVYLWPFALLFIGVALCGQFF